MTNLNNLNDPVLNVLTLRYPKFCPQAAFTVSFSLTTNIDVIPTTYVLFNVETKHLTIIPIHLNWPCHGSDEFTVLSPWRVRFDPGAVHFRFAVDEIAVRHVPLPVLRPSLLSIISQMLHTRPTDKWANFGTFRQFKAVSDKGELLIET